MKRNFKALLCASAFILSTGLTSCGGSSKTSDKLTIRILNLEDYIYLNDPDAGYDEPDLTEQFEEYYKETFGKDIQVIYETSDTNESIYNDLLTGRTKYDLVCTSDYMLQKFVREGLITKLHEDEDDDWLENYHTYASPTIKDRLDRIEVKMSDGHSEYLEDYCVGYMWGTLGILFNPSYGGADEQRYEEALSDMASWNALWDSKYKNTISIKDSMRDTYAAALMHVYDDELQGLKEQYEDGELTAEEYNKNLTTVFNKTDDETLKLVADSLEELKKNIFGMEVDSGKQDIVTGKIGVNLAYSGDAVYSMDLADKETSDSTTDHELYYSVPVNGANIWFDGWCIPTDPSRSEEQFKAAHDFLDYISMPDNAAKNMDYTGYTSYIGGDTIYELVLDWYDARTDLIYYYDEKGEYESDDDRYLSLFYQDPETDEEMEVWYEDCHFEEDEDPAYDGVLLYYYPDNDHEQTPKDYKIGDTKQYYNAALRLEEVEEVNLGYFFDGTLEEYDEAIFYVDYYCEDNGAVGRQFFVQYPSEEVITRCAVMDDYGDAQNIKVLKMWESFKSNSLPLWATILLIIMISLIVFGIVYWLVGKHVKKTLRIKRSQNQ